MRGFSLRLGRRMAIGLLLVYGLAGCAAVSAYQRERLVDPIMSFHAQAKKEFHWVREHYELENVLHSIDFVKKDSCRAIQLADLIAFYSRRDGVALLKTFDIAADDDLLER